MMIIINPLGPAPPDFSWVAELPLTLAFGTGQKKLESAIGLGPSVCLSVCLYTLEWWRVTQSGRGLERMKCRSVPGFHCGRRGNLNGLELVAATVAFGCCWEES